MIRICSEFMNRQACMRLNLIWKAFDITNVMILQGSLQTCNKRGRLGCLNHTSWLPLATGAGSSNLAFTFSCISVCMYKNLRPFLSPPIDSENLASRICSLLLGEKQGADGRGFGLGSYPVRINCQCSVIRSQSRIFLYLYDLDITHGKRGIVILNFSCVYQHL